LKKPLFLNDHFSFGKNLRIAYTDLFGLTFEDSYVVSDRLLKEETFNSIHVEEIEIPVFKNNYGEEKITKEVINSERFNLDKLDEDGVIKINSFVKSGDILVSKVSPVYRKDESPEQRFLMSVLGEKNFGVKNSFFHLPKEIPSGFVNSISYVRGRYSLKEFSH